MYMYTGNLIILSFVVLGCSRILTSFPTPKKKVRISSLLLPLEKYSVQFLIWGIRICKMAPGFSNNGLFYLLHSNFMHSCLVVRSRHSTMLATGARPKIGCVWIKRKSMYINACISNHLPNEYQVSLYNACWRQILAENQGHQRNTD